MKAYLDAVREVLEKGTRRENRTGVDTIATFNINYEIDLRRGFPLLTTKKISWKNIVVENLWFLSGDTNVRFLHEHGCRFWDPWVDGEGLVPSAYGNFWRNFPVPDVDGKMRCNDQLRWVVSELRNNPMSRRHVVTAWAPQNAQSSALPPCHCMFVLSVQNDEGRPVLNLHLTQRSCDMALGVPYNIAGYALLLELFARFANIPAGIFAHTLVDAHIYTCKPDGSMEAHDHVPGLKEQLQRSPKPLPRLRLSPEIQTLEDVELLLKQSTEEILAAVALEGYDPHPPIRFKVAV